MRNSTYFLRFVPISLNRHICFATFSLKIFPLWKSLNVFFGMLVFSLHEVTKLLRILLWGYVIYHISPRISIIPHFSFEWLCWQCAFLPFLTPYPSWSSFSKFLVGKYHIRIVVYFILFHFIFGEALFMSLCMTICRRRKDRELFYFRNSRRGIVH